MWPPMNGSVRRRTHRSELLIRGSAVQVCEREPYKTQPKRLGFFYGDRGRKLSEAKSYGGSHIKSRPSGRLFCVWISGFWSVHHSLPVLNQVHRKTEARSHHPSAQAAGYTPRPQQQRNNKSHVGPGSKPRRARAIVPIQANFIIPGPSIQPACSFAWSTADRQQLFRCSI